MQSFTRLKPIGIALLVGASFVACSNSKGASANNSKPLPVHIYTVAEETARRNVQAVGSLFALEESTLSAEVDGVVSKVLVDVGDTVTAGQRELEFDLERQRGAVREARAQLGIGPDAPPPPDSRTLPSVQHAQADLFDAERKYARAQGLFKDRLISQQQLDEAASRYQSTKATYEISLQEIDRLKALLISTEASEKLAEKKLSDATVRAPFSGSIRSRNIHPGEYLRAQTAVMVLVRTDSLRARLAVPERWAGWVNQNAIVNLQVEAFPGENKDGRLKPGFFVQASLPSEKQEKALFVPDQAVNYRYGVYKVFMLNGDHVSERQIRPAGQTEDEKGKRFEVAEGLKAGDRVAVPLSGELRDGVRVQETSTSPEENKTVRP